MNTQFLVNQLLQYRTGNLTRDALNQMLDQRFLQLSERLQKGNRIEDIFLSQILLWMTTISEQAYGDADIDCLIDALQGKRALSYHCRLRITPDMLSEYERQVLTIAQEYLTEKRYESLSETSQATWQNILARRSRTRTEFYSIETVTEWLACQMEWLLRIAMSQTVPNRTGYRRDEAENLLEHYTAVLDGRQNAYLIVGKMSLSVL